MSHNFSYKLIINNIDSFSLKKDKNNNIFDVRKAVRYKNINQNNKSYSTVSIDRKDLIINKIINFNFIAIVKKLNKFNNNDNHLTFKNEINIEKRPSFLNINKDKKDIKKNNAINNSKPKYCKKIFNKKVDKNVLIKPIMVEDNSMINPIIQKKEAPKKINDMNNQFINYNNYFNNNSFFILNKDNTFYSNPFLFNLNQFPIKNLNDKQVIENKLKAPIFYQGPYRFLNLNQYYLKELINKKNELDKINFNKEFIKNLNNLSNKTKTEKTITFVNELNKSLPKSNQSQDSAGASQYSNIFVKTVNKSKGRKAKNADNSNSDSKHTKYSADNMMRKIKNKVIESSRLLINKVLRDEIESNKNIKFTLTHREFRKIQGSFSQELNIKYNFWFYQITIKDIFCLEISNKYSAIEKSSNKLLIEYLFSPSNNFYYLKTKQLLNMPFHQFYHDIFLGEDPNWKNIYGIKENENKYQIQYVLKNLEEEEKGATNNDPNINYIEDINNLAHHYEDFFLNKKPRNVDYNNKKNQFIKTFMNNSLNDKYLQLCEEVKQLKTFYENRNALKEQGNQVICPNQINEKTIDNSFTKKTENKINYFETKDFLNNNLFMNTFKIEMINKPNINLDEKNEIENFNNNISGNLINNNASEKKFEKTNTNSNNISTLCNKKRKGDKIKYFISYEQ
jgi:hypothetical protein